MDWIGSSKRASSIICTRSDIGIDQLLHPSNQRFTDPDAFFLPEAPVFEKS
jgi:hypothetical protein